MPEIHARLSASGAKRWMSCPPSVKLEEQFNDEESTYAAEGTFAHSLAELYLRYNNGEISKKAFTTRLNKLRNNDYFSEEMNDYITDYANSVWEIFNEAKASCPDAMILFEQRLDFSEYVPDGFGTGDVVIIADDLVQVIDLKYGKGVGVSAVENPQLRLYGLGAYAEHSMLYDINRIKTTIIQPRLENVSTEESDVVDLVTWGENVVKPAAELAAAGEGEYCVGDHCRFCKARKTCRARADHNLELAAYEFRDASLLEDTEIGEVLKRATELASWVADITGYAQEQAIKHGKKFPGWKLVEGRSDRKYTDKEQVANTLFLADYTDEQIYKPKELLGITAMEKQLGKKQFAELLGELIHKPEGKPVLVQESDRRPELSSTASAKEDFE